MHGLNALLGQLALESHLCFKEFCIDLTEFFGQGLHLFVIGGVAIQLGIEFGLLGKQLLLELRCGCIMLVIGLLRGGLLLRGQAGNVAVHGAHVVAAHIVSLGAGNASQSEHSRQRQGQNERGGLFHDQSP